MVAFPMGITRRILAIWLACTSVCVASPSVPHEHVVQPGQTLAKIAKRYRVDLDDLCSANDLKKSAKLQPGTRLSIPSDDDRTDGVGHRGDTASYRESRASVASGRRLETERRGTSARTASYSQYLARPTRRGWVHVMGHHGEWHGQLVSKTGKLQPKAVAALSRLLAWPRADFTMDRRLLTLLAHVSDAFGGRIVRVVSGYRTTSYSSESKHPLGRACDFHVLGVPNAALRDFIRTFENVGVGYYPNSTFVHLDVRDHDAYWVDYAGPGEPPRATRHRVARKAEDTATSEPESESMNPEAQADMQVSQEERRDATTQATPAAHAPASNDGE